MGRKSPPPSSDIESGEAAYHMTRPLPPPLSQQYFYPPPSPNKQWFPFLVPLIFAANIALFTYSMYVNDCPSTTGTDQCVLYDLLGRYSFQPLRENPLLGPSTITLQVLGALERKLVVNSHEEWRFFTCIWLHAGVIHLAANMLSLLFIGVRLEQEFGFLRIGLLYGLSGVGGSLLSALYLTSTISVGASGALFGLLGAMLSELITNWTIYANKCAALLTLVLVIGINLAVGFLPHVDSSAHIGGFLSGFLLGFILLIRPQFGYVSRKNLPPGYDAKHMKSRHKFYQYFLCVTALALLIIGYSTKLSFSLDSHHYKGLFGLALTSDLSIESKAEAASPASVETLIYDTE